MKDYYPRNYFKTDPSIGFYLGVTPCFQLSERISVTAPIQYSKEGHQEHQDAYSQYKAGYMRIMPQAEIRVYKGLHFSGGANIGWLIHEQILNPANNWEEPNLPLADNSNVAAIIGLKFYVKKAFISFRYTQSESSTTTDIPAPVGIEIVTSQLNNNFQLGVGYRFK